ncbi:DNA-binding response regulator [Roseobacter denitrificans]|uniref:Two-component response regulator, putative n=1 Tax=Roseobacter denitrificans (strain ATCC 33942 / OCh 114) TaxID=375451 RepID=Q162Z5_ROSDO|nr:response regulator transcription factor [Roseobacter denitrificans]ABG32948.1 two-component response regulator, putative [Roseobacter denitrificans OCh 114]AVL52338.1 DNA-binding response regulator [Roseobacter denitrificans]SFG10670.1 two-component system, OmpR family, response regulator [Roseobacter denitrificans OCh 114]
MRVLLVEDHPQLADAVRDALVRAGFAVDHAGTAAEAREMSSLAEYDIALLDLGLPDGDGMALLPTLRRDGTVPVIVLTAREQLTDRLSGLDGGADDYVVKPVEMPELVARCRAVLRRPGDRSGTVLNHGDLALDTAALSVTVAGTGVPLGRREVAVLEHLMRAAGRVSARRVLEEAVYGFDDEVSPNAIEASISRLRRTLAMAGSGANIVTVRGIGWMLPRGDGA